MNSYLLLVYVPVCVPPFPNTIGYSHKTRAAELAANTKGCKATQRWTGDVMYRHDLKKSTSYTNSNRMAQKKILCTVFT